MKNLLKINVLLLVFALCVKGQFYVGTNPDDSDVIDDNVVQDDWTEQEASGKFYNIGGDQELINWSSFITFYIWTDDDDVQVKIDTYQSAGDSDFKVAIQNDNKKLAKSQSIQLDLESNEINSFNVYFECPQNDQGPFQVTVTINDDLSFYFQKLCVNGNRNDLCVIIDTDEGEAEVMNDGELESEFDFENPTYEISGIEDSYSTLEFTVENGVQIVKRMKAWTESDIDVEIKGEVRGVIDLEDELSINVFYDCGKFEGTAKIQFEMLISPFEPVQFSWLKKCGSSYKGIYLGSQLGSPNIYDKGDIRLIFDEPVLSYDSHIMRPDVIMASKESSFISSNIPQKITIKFNCINKGNYRVTVTIPLEQGGYVDFPILKECEKPKIIRDTSAMTANKLVFLMGIIIVLIALFTLRAGIKKLGSFNNQ